MTNVNNPFYSATATDSNDPVDKEEEEEEEEEEEHTVIRRPMRVKTSTHLHSSSPLAQLHSLYNPIQLAAISNYKLAQLTFTPPDSHSMRKTTLVKNMLELLYEVTPPEWLDQMTRWEFFSPDSLSMVSPEGIEGMISEYAQAIEAHSPVSLDDGGDQGLSDEDMWIDDEDVIDDHLSHFPENPNLAKSIFSHPNNTLNATEGDDDDGGDDLPPPVPSKTAGVANGNNGAGNGFLPNPKRVSSLLSSSSNKSLPAIPGGGGAPAGASGQNINNPYRNRKSVHGLPVSAASPQVLASEIIDLFNMDFKVEVKINTAPKLPELPFASPLRPDRSGLDDSLLWLVPAIESGAIGSGNGDAIDKLVRRRSTLNSSSPLAPRPPSVAIPPPPNMPPPPPPKDDKHSSRRTSSLPDLRKSLTPPSATRSWTTRKSPKDDAGTFRANPPKRSSSLSMHSTPRPESLAAVNSSFATLRQFLDEQDKAEMEKKQAKAMRGHKKKFSVASISAGLESLAASASNLANSSSTSIPSTTTSVDNPNGSQSKLKGLRKTPSFLNMGALLSKSAPSLSAGSTSGSSSSSRGGQQQQNTNNNSPTSSSGSTSPPPISTGSPRSSTSSDIKIPSPTTIKRAPIPSFSPPQVQADLPTVYTKSHLPSPPGSSSPSPNASRASVSSLQKPLPPPPDSDSPPPTPSQHTADIATPRVPPLRTTSLRKTKKRRSVGTNNVKRISISGTIASVPEEEYPPPPFSLDDMTSFDPDAPPTASPKRTKTFSMAAIKLIGRDRAKAQSNKRRSNAASPARETSPPPNHNHYKGQIGTATASGGIGYVVPKKVEQRHNAALSPAGLDLTDGVPMDDVPGLTVMGKGIGHVVQGKGPDTSGNFVKKMVAMGRMMKNRAG